MRRELSFAEAIREALAQKLTEDKAVYVLGQGAPDASQTYGTTQGLVDIAPDRIFDVPLSEASMVGIMLGSSLVGLKPVMIMARFEFLLLAIEQLVNQAAKWRFMFPEDPGQTLPFFTLRVVVGRGWGQGPQHAQSLHAWFAHVPGLKVVMPATPYEAKGLLLASIDDPNPVLFIEHRWLHPLRGFVPEETYTIPLESGLTTLMQGDAVTVVSLSYATVDAYKAAQLLKKEGIFVSLLSVHTINPFQDEIILESVCQTGRLVVCDPAYATGGFSSEIISRVCMKALNALKSPPVKVAYPDRPLATTRALANLYYPGAHQIVNAVKRVLGLPEDKYAPVLPSDLLDVPDKSFTGPF